MAPPGNPIASAARLVAGNRQARYFASFISFAIFALFLQESLIEVLGAEVFGAGIRETTRFQPIWGGGILLGMLLMGLLSTFVSVPKKTLTLIGCTAAAGGFFILGIIALLQTRDPAGADAVCHGRLRRDIQCRCTGDDDGYDVDGATGLYMGLWGTAQAMGMGGSAVAAGALHTALIGSGLLAAQNAYWLIFSVEGGAASGCRSRAFSGRRGHAFQRNAAQIAQTRNADNASIPDIAATSARA